MNLSIAAFTAAGGALAERLQAALAGSAHTVVELRVLRKGGAEPLIPLSEWTRAAFAGDGIVFIGACGIAVRAIAPFVRDKLTDPAVVSIDEQGRFAVPLLSGHVGGANALAAELAALLGGTAVISTATDLNGIFAVDVWAAKQGICLCEREHAKEVSAALLDGRQVGLYSDFETDGALPDGLVRAEAGELGICVSLDAGKSPFSCTLHAVPRIVTVGAGCRRGVAEDVFEQAVLETLTAHGISMQAVSGLATIDIKRDEPCVRAFCEKYSLPMHTASAQALAQVQGEFTPSAFVSEVTGVDNVCERAAVFAGNGSLIIKKHAQNAVTAAAAAINWRLHFGR